METTSVSGPTGRTHAPSNNHCESRRINIRQAYHRDDIESGGGRGGRSPTPINGEHHCMW